jgi:hypothetical protein
MTQYRQFLGQSFDRLDDYLRTLPTQQSNNDTPQGEGQ